MVRILDLCCGEGGAAMGYYRATSKVANASNVQIIGVDKRKMIRYPFGFIQCDALELDYDFLLSFDFIHASPPCKAYTVLRHFAKRDKDESFLPRLLTTLEATGKPYVVENVPQAPIRADIQLDGTMFDLPLKRRRIFQTNMNLPKYPRETSYSENLDVVTCAGSMSTLKSMREAMQINWMSKLGIVEAIPPAYTEWIFNQVLTHGFLVAGCLEPELILDAASKVVHHADA